MSNLFVRGYHLSDETKDVRLGVDRAKTEQNQQPVQQPRGQTMELDNLET